MADKTIFVNEGKKGRSQEIFDLVSGKLVPRNADEIQRLEHYSRILNANKVDLKKETEAVTFIYLKLGGLMRTDAEEKVAKEKKVEAQSKGRKDKMGLR